MTASVRDLFHAHGGSNFTLAKTTPKPPRGTHRRSVEKETARDLKRLARWQERLWAEGARSALVLLQGMDTSGKDGTIKHVLGAMNPQGCRVTPFKAPTPQELAHTFLWRIRKALPAPGEVGVFNRSHYEDVGAARVERLVPEAVWRARYGVINRFEKGLVAHGTTIVKIFLHISPEEQRLRLLKRLENSNKHWKFKSSDLDTRKKWSGYMEAYTDAIVRCSTAAAPWYVVPADAKWYRNWVIGRILVETFEEMKPRYPDPEIDVEAFKARLRAERPVSSSSR